MTRIILVWGLAITIGACGGAFAQDTGGGKGAATIVFEKIRMNPVSFPHHLHQTALENQCNACHDLFPKKPGVIREMISQKALAHQQVMNTKCIACHKSRIAESKSAGPVKCTECHVRAQ